MEVHGHHLLAVRLAHGARIVSYQPPEIVLSGTRPIAADTLSETAAALRTITGVAWKLSLLDAPGEPTLKEAQDAIAEAERQAVLASPIVQAAMEAFPDAELIDGPNKRNSA
jgi:DNA polymerase-3 subunit gamma/tau